MLRPQGEPEKEVEGESVPETVLDKESENCLKKKGVGRVGEGM